MFEIEQLIDDCLTARQETDDHKAVREIVARAVDDSAAVLRGLGEPKKAGVNVLYQSDGLTVLNLVWGPMMTLMPHNHASMWAVIGIYTGREDNIFWRRISNASDGRIEAAGAEALSVGDVAPLGPEIIHSVTNPIPRLTGALHVYGGDFFGDGRSEWDAETLIEGVYDINKNLKLFQKSNAALSSA